MMSSVTNADLILAAINQSPGATDAQLVGLTGIEPHQQVNQICRRLAQAGMTRRSRRGDGRIGNFPITADKVRSVNAPTDSPSNDPQTVGDVEGATDSLPGTRTSFNELRSMGFVPFALNVTKRAVLLSSGIGVDWNTEGEVPAGPGLYAFTIEDAAVIHVAYVGLTLDLWMVTKGQLSTGGGRGGQRYGRPRYAGVTRERVNILVAAQLRLGRSVQHWLKPYVAGPATDLRAGLRAAEKELIDRWDLRTTGWNRR